MPELQNSHAFAVMLRDFRILQATRESMAPCDCEKDREKCFKGMWSGFEKSIAKLSQQLQPVVRDLKPLPPKGIDQRGVELVQQFVVKSRGKISHLTGLETADVVMSVATAVVSSRAIGIG